MPVERISRSEIERALRAADAPEDSMATDDDLIRYEGRAEAVEIVRDMLQLEDWADCCGGTCRIPAAHPGVSLQDVLGGVRTHNGAPITPKNLRWAARHEALARSYIFDVLNALADALEADA